ncbi:MAG: hypothetical protein AB7O71_17200 [Hyphomicrobiaceae bacterium]
MQASTAPATHRNNDLGTVTGNPRTVGGEDESLLKLGRDMDYHLDRSIHFVSETNTNLYRWALQEVSPEGASKARHQIPWPWNLWFLGTEIRLLQNVGTGAMNANHKLNERVHISLQPYGNGRYAPRYSMFGTTRTISQISLDVYQLEDDTSPPQCQAWGIVSYTSEIDFRDETTPDVLGFNLRVCSATFDAVKRLASRHSCEDTIVFRAGGVAGIYSDWSPSISADFFKVLTSYPEQHVESPASAFVLPRLGSIDEFNLSIERLKPLSLRKLAGDGDEQPDEPQHPSPQSDLEPGNIAPPGVSFGQLISEVDRLRRTVSTLRFPLWLLLIVGIALVVK